VGEVKDPVLKHAGRALHQAKKHRVSLLRGLLLIAVGALLIQPGGRDGGAASLALIVVYSISNLALFFLPDRLIQSLRFEFVIGAADLMLVGLGLHLSGMTATALPISVALMVLVVALGNYRAHTVAGAAAIGALHSWLVLGQGRGAEVAWQLALQMLFLCAVALYYGNLASGIHQSLRREQHSELERKELSTLVDILDAVTSSLDVQRVASTIVSKITEVIPAMRCSMLLINEDKTRCYVMASHDDPSIDMFEIDLKKYPEIRCAIETRDRVLISDVSLDPMMADVRDVLEDLHFQSIMVVPMTFANDVLGTLCLKTARVDKSYSQAEINFCTVVARASANALKNALLHKRVLEQASINRETGQKLSTVLDQSPDLIVTTDTHGRITEFNRGAARLTGRSRGEMVGRSSESILGADGSSWIEKISNRGRITNHAISLTKADGSELNLELNMAALTDRNGDVYGTVWVGRDVTELRSAQLQLLQAKKLSSIGEVISGVAHELNNPLSGVLGFSQLLMARHGQGPMARELDQIHNSALRCQKIVKNLLSFSRVHKPERKYLGLNGIVDKTLEVRRYQLEVNNIDVIKDLEPDLPKTMLDFHQIQQVLVNLLNNAQQAIQAARPDRGELKVRTWHQDATVVLQVSDNGEGMDPETLERVFDPFFTTKDQGQGTGLGLSVSYGIIKEHGGKIYAQGRKGEGSTFRIEFPVYEEVETGDTLADNTEPLNLEGADGAGRRILVVDDEPTILDLFVEILGSAGYAVDTADNGVEAAQKVRNGPYDVVVSDIRMPRMNGIQLYDEILAVRPELADRMLFVTGDLIDPETHEFVERVGARTIAKPLEIRQVLQVIEEVLDSIAEPEWVG
jgi:PAS domain S-box-containing protein